MIINHDERGFIYHICSEPNDAEALSRLLAYDGALHVPAIALPEVPVRAENGKLVIEDGKVKRESPGYTQQDVTHEFHMVVVAEDGTKKVVDRPRLPTGDVDIKANGKDAFRLDTVPGAVIKIDGEEYMLTDGKLEFTTADAGTYLFEAGFPFVDWAVKVVAR